MSDLFRSYNISANLQAADIRMDAEREKLGSLGFFAAIK